MSLQTRAEVAVEITAQDSATRVTKRTTDQINRDFAGLRKEQRAIRGEFELNNRSLVSAGRALSTVGAIAGNITSIYTKYNVMQLRVSDANRTVRETHEDYLRALADTGPFSEEARRANEAHQRALEDQKRAADEARLGMIFLGVEIAGSAGRMIGAIPRIKEMATALRGLAGASTLAGAAAIGGNVLPGSAGTAGKAAGLLGVTGLAAAGVVGAGVAGGVAHGAGMSFGVTSAADAIAGTNLTGALASQLKGFDQQVTGGLFGGAIDFLTGNKAQEFDRQAAASKVTVNQNTFSFEGYDSQEAQRIISEAIESNEVYGS